jgi:hypothetical protein
MRRLLSLGDSFSCGEGVGLRYRPEQTWTALLAEGLGLDRSQFARPGATTAEVATHRDFAAVVLELGAVVDLVLVARWHPPLAQYHLPRSLQQGALRRIGEVNTAIDAAVDVARDRGVRVAVIDLGAEPRLRSRRAWAIDRIHPGADGHQVIAWLAHRAVDPAFIDGPPAVLRTDDLSALTECRWIARHGLPWLIRRMRLLSGPVAAMGAGGRNAAEGDRPAVPVVQP